MSTRVAIVGMSLNGTRAVGRYQIDGIPDPTPAGASRDFGMFPRSGLDGTLPARGMLKAEWIDEYYRAREPWYMAACENLIQVLAPYDIVVFSTFSFLHPEMIADRLFGKICVLGFTDDPYSTYIRGIPYLWAFDAAYYISPSYSPTKSFADLFVSLKFPKARWLPLVQPIDFPLLNEADIRRRTVGACYVGHPTRTKYARLARMVNAFGGDMRLHGRWRLGGRLGYVAPLVGGAFLPRRITPISIAQKRDLYLDTKIGLNMHVSDVPSECGNMRTYEAAQFGMMLLSDRAGLDLQNTIFEDGREAIYYSDTDEAIDLARHYMANDDARTAIALAAHRRAHEEYRWEKVWHNFLDWL